MVGKKKKDILSKLCNIQREFNDAVIFRIGISDNGRIIDIISADNTFSIKKQEKKSSSLDFQLPEVPEYIG